MTTAGKVTTKCCYVVESPHAPHVWYEAAATFNCPGWAGPSDDGPSRESCSACGCTYEFHVGNSGTTECRNGRCDCVAYTEPGVSDDDVVPDPARCDHPCEHCDEYDEPGDHSQTPWVCAPCVAKLVEKVRASGDSAGTELRSDLVWAMDELEARTDDLSILHRITETWKKHRLGSGPSQETSS